MPCEEFDNRILEFLENQLPPAERATVETHLAGCARCRMLARQLQQIDAALTQGIKLPMLPRSFTARLQQRIQTEATLLSETHRADRKRQMQAEFEAELARLRRQLISSVNPINTLGYAVLVALAGWLILRLMSIWTNLVAQPDYDRFGQNLLPAGIISAVFLLIGLSVAFHEELKVRPTRSSSL